MSPQTTVRMRGWAGATALWLWAGAAFAAPPPQLGAEGRAGYEEYLAAGDHRAFAIAPGGAWALKTQAASRGEAEDAALAACGGYTPQKCVLFSVDGRTVFDGKAWPRLWGPYLDAGAAQRAPVGRRPGERFANLAFSGADGRPKAIADLRGKVVVLHFWGSWCGPCRREMPELQKLHESLKGRADIAFVLLQVREAFSASRQWATAQKLRLPFQDSGASANDPFLHTADGARIGDRDIASSFPTTYILDKRGIVVFSHVGPVPDWNEYRDFLLDAAQRSGR